MLWKNCSNVLYLLIWKSFLRPWNDFPIQIRKLQTITLCPHKSLCAQNCDPSPSPNLSNQTTQKKKSQLTEPINHVLRGSFAMGLFRQIIEQERERVGIGSSNSHNLATGHGKEDASSVVSTLAMIDDQIGGSI